MTRSRAKHIKEIMGLLAQTMVDETLIIGIKQASLMLGSGEETRWINLIQVAKDGAE